VVRSVKETLSSQFVENCKGVVQRLTLQEHKMVWNRTTHLWNDYEKIIHQRTNTTPFDLVPQEAGAGMAVRVMKPLEAAELSLETVYEKFHPSVQSFTDVIGHYISGERPKGIQETEQMLKVGTALTGGGELVLDNATIDEFRQAQERLLHETSAEGSETLKNACVVCLSAPKSCVFLECGHVCSCSECYQALPEPKKCPMCRQSISRVVPLYNS
ncbi:PREDICTED: mitochondrial ubiquitin ligase activator of NFKB 1, partial [Buceros rhinoceros silvestris]